MKDFLYYPGFEIEDEDWLKFALLYMDNVKTIVPEYADVPEGLNTKFIKQNTDLLEEYNPKYIEGEKSTKEAIEILKKISSVNSHKYGFKNIDLWRDEAFHISELYSGKYTQDFEHYCIDEGIASKTGNGILIPQELSLAYMSIFAHNIGDRNNMSIITDSKDQERLSLLNDNTWKYNPDLEQLKTLKKIVNINIPAHLKDVTFHDIVKLRETEDFQNKLQSFNKALNNFTSSEQRNLSESNYRKFLDSLYSLENASEELNNTLKETFVTVISTSLILGMALVDSASGVELIQQGIGLAATSYLSVNASNRVYRNELPDNLAPRYLTDLHKLGRGPVNWKY